MKKEYTIGLDIGTNSVGWCVMNNEDYQLIRKNMKIYGTTDKTKMKKNFWGVRLFDEGETAEDRRLKRNTRRRYLRRKNRLRYLQNFFAPEIYPVDPNFYHRLSESFYVSEDKQYSQYPIFGKLEEDKAYYKQYPTIYHLRKRLVDDPSQEDIRLVYLACAHIIKYRGHFLIEGKLSTENTSIKEAFQRFINVYQDVAEDFMTDLPPFEMLDLDIESVMLAPLSRQKKAERLLSYFPNEKSNGLLGQLIKLMVGNQGNFKRIFKLDDEFKFKYSEEDYELTLDQLLDEIGEDYAPLFDAARSVYEAVELSQILTTKDKVSRAQLSSSMVDRYEDHQQDLKRLKRLIKDVLPDQYEPIFHDPSQDGYAGYIHGSTSEEEFYRYLKKVLTSVADEQAQYFLDKIDQENFLRKQRTYDNGNIPHQIHLAELALILENQGAYYPELRMHAEEIKSLLSFKIPYYVGPLTSSKHSDFAWMHRKTSDPIRPWNFEDVVDVDQSAQSFIERMTNYDTYLPEEKVLPKQSMTYQLFAVLNELNKVTYETEQGRKAIFSKKDKEAIIQHLFKQHRVVTKKHLEKYLRSKFDIGAVTVTRGIEDRFNAKLTTYHDFLNVGVSHEFLDDPNHQELLEEIVFKMTIFEDQQMRSRQLEMYQTYFDSEVWQRLTRMHYTGWGRLSYQLIAKLEDKHTHKTIMDFLFEENRNFMELIRDPNLTFKEAIEQAQTEMEYHSLEAQVADLPGSPAIKKGILQSLKIVDELVSIMNAPPKRIVIEMAREYQGSKRSVSRLKKIEQYMKELGSSLLQEHPVTNQDLQNQKVLLYFLQNGKDMYTGETIDFDRLEHYDTDHIIPQSFITDNSIDNLVLTSAKKNRGKQNNVPSQEVVQQQKGYWKKLLAAGMISQQKFNALTKIERGGLKDHDKQRFIKRQLVETRQITKYVAQILNERFNDPTLSSEEHKTEIVTLKSSLVTQFRDLFNLYKLRELNDYHHAHDAYLAAVVGSTLVNAFPNLRGEFVYGEIPKYIWNKNNPINSDQRLNMYSNLMKYFEVKEEQDVEQQRIWNQHKLSTVKRVLDSRQMNIVKKVEQQKGALFKQTLYSSKDKKKLIPIKNHLDPLIYGGYIEPVTAFSAFIEYKKGKKQQSTFEIVGIPIKDISVYRADVTHYLTELGYQDPKVLVELPKYSLFELDSGKRRMLASAQEVHKANQLVVSQKLVKLLVHSKKALDNKIQSIEYIEKNRFMYDELVQELLIFMNKYISIDKYVLEIKKLYEDNKDKDILLVASSILSLVQFLKVGGSSDLIFFESKLNRIRFRSKKDLQELFDGVLIYQSITGLYETRIKVGDLK